MQDLIPDISYSNLHSLKEPRRTLLVSSKSLAGTRDALAGVNVVAVEIVRSSEWRHLEAVLPVDDVQAVVGVGGGRVMDAAKLRGARLTVPVTCVPSVLSTDAFLTATAAVRDGGRLRYLPTGAPARVVIDEALLLQTPAWMNALGCCDVLSIVTATDDWRRDLDACPSPSMVEEGRRLCETLLAAQDEITAGTPGGLSAVLNALAAEVRLCAAPGSDRLEEGSEHYFACALETRVPRQMHGVLVGLGILFAARLQGQDIDRLCRFLGATGIARACLAISREAIVETLCWMPRFVREGCYPASVWSRVVLNEAEAARLCDDVFGRLRP